MESGDIGHIHNLWFSLFVIMTRRNWRIPRTKIVLRYVLAVVMLLAAERGYL